MKKFTLYTDKSRENQSKYLSFRLLYGGLEQQQQKKLNKWIIYYAEINIYICIGAASRIRKRNNKGESRRSEAQVSRQ